MFIQIASLPPGMASAGDLAADAAFQEHCREGLTDALTRGGEPANITVDSVVATSRSESSAARRLQTTSGPSLQLLRVNLSMAKSRDSNRKSQQTATK
ncbi:unnamed protein product [Polarella glacialis]|uniref:Uncharacterized protein n=1 Tax=Polarella glacialis TaxID=89957 RepID=A0A813LGI0_POLGL|nr:unnamed protein product [Polarella glacialis]